MLRVVGRGLGVATAATVGGLTAGEYVAPDAGAIRSWRFWRGSLPIFARYKYVEYLTNAGLSDEESTAKYEALHDKYAPVIRDLTLDLQGFFYKMAQIISTRDEFIPQQYMVWCKDLQDKCPKTLGLAEVRELVEAGVGRPVDEVFKEFEAEPLGAASIGQVHRAELMDGTRVAVKVQYPGMEKKFRSDIAAVGAFCDLLMPQHSPYFNEIRKQFQTEFDYAGEGNNLLEVRDNVSRAGFDVVCEIPMPIMELTSRGVLVMTYLPGKKLVDAVKESYQRLAASRGQKYEELEEEMMQAIRDGTLKRKSLRQASKDMARTTFLLSWYDWFMNIGVTAGNWTVAPLVKGWGKQFEYYNSELPPNLGRILEVLLRVHGAEIFQGAFNADCHPGNVLLMPDGRLGLVDYGQVKRMTDRDRVIYAKLVLALSRDDKDEIVRLMTDEVGFKTRDMNPDIIYKTVVFWNDRDTDDITGGMNVHHFIEHLDAVDPVVNVNDEFVMLGRLSILLRGMANAFGLQVRVSDFWKDEARAFLKSKNIEY